MKNQLLLILGLALFFIACEKESEFVNKTDVQSLSQRSECIELTTTHWLTGFGKDQPIREISLEETNGNKMPSRHYVIEASGDAMSETYARGFSELNLVYNTRTYKLTGVLTTRFYNDEVLELKFDGNVQTRYVGNTMTLRINVNEASFNSGAEVLYLNNGEINIVLPSTPEGHFEMEINTKELLCAL